MNKYAEALHLVREKEPLVQCITNFVTVNDCANIILAAGGSPSMAHDVREAAEAARNARALVCNMGAIEDAPSMILAGKEMNKLGRPVVLDPVAAGGTSLRREVAAELLKEVKFSSIRGNASEIRYLAGQQTAGSGVDVSALDKIRISKKQQRWCGHLRNAREVSLLFQESWIWYPMGKKRQSSETDVQLWRGLRAAAVC